MLEDFCISAKEEALLRLVEHNIKPAANLGSVRSIVSRWNQINNTPITQDQVIFWYQNYFDRFNFKHNLLEYRNSEDKLFFPFVGSNYSNLKKISKALELRSHLEMGLSLGFPQEDVDAFVFKKSINLFDWDIALAKAKKENIEIPSWLAYLYHMPAKLDLIQGDIPHATRVLGKKYFEFISSSYPSLAKEMEYNFRLEIEQNLPLNWSITPKDNYNHYSLVYPLKKVEANLYV